MGKAKKKKKKLPRLTRIPRLYDYDKITDDIRHSFDPTKLRLIKIKEPNIDEIVLTQDADEVIKLEESFSNARSVVFEIRETLVLEKFIVSANYWISSKIKSLGTRIYFETRYDTFSNDNTTVTLLFDSYWLDSNDNVSFVISVAMTEDETIAIVPQATRDVDEFKNILLKLVDDTNPLAIQGAREVSPMWISACMALTSYCEAQRVLLDVQSRIIHVSEPRRIQNTGNLAVPNISSERTKTAVERKVYVYKNEQTNPTSSGRKVNCPCYTVRGHTRTLKSGKTIWIKPYYKGTDRNNPQKHIGKEYH